MKMCARAVAFLFVSAAAASAAHADEVGEALLRTVIDRIDASPQWTASAGAISSEGNATLVDGLKIGREDGSAAFEIAKLRAEGLAPNGERGFTLSRFTISDIKATGSNLTVSVPDVHGGLMKTAGTSGWQFDAEKPFTSAATLITQLATTEFDEITIPTIAFAVRMQGDENGPSTSGQYSDLRIGPLKGGVLVAESLARMETTGTVAPGEPPVTSVTEKIEARNIDVGAFARVLDPAAYGTSPDREWKRVEESVSYAKVTIHNGIHGDVSFGPVTARDFAVRQTTAPLAPALDALVSKGEPSEADTLAFFEEHASDLFGWFRLGSMSLSDLSVTQPEGHAGLASVALTGLSADGLEHFGLNDFKADVQGFSAGLKNFELASVAWPKFATLVALAELDKQSSQDAPDAALVARLAGDIFNVVPYIGRLTLAGFNVTLPGGEPLTFDTFEIANEGGTALLPKLAQIKLLSLILPRAVLRITPESAQIFDLLGYDRLQIEAGGRTDYDDAPGDYGSEFRLGAKDAGVLALQYSLGGLTPGSIETMVTPFIASAGKEPDPETLKAAFGPLMFKGLTLKFTDSSLTRRILAAFEKMRDIDEPTLIGNAAAVLQLGLSQLSNQRFTDETVSAARVFLNNPQSITLTLKPLKPVSVNELLQVDPNNPGAAIDLLGVSVSAND